MTEYVENHKIQQKLKKPHKIIAWYKWNTIKATYCDIIEEIRCNFVKLIVLQSMCLDCSQLHHQIVYKE